MHPVSLVTLLSRRDIPETSLDVLIYLAADKSKPLEMEAFNVILHHLWLPECRPPLPETVYLSGGGWLKRDDDRFQCIQVKGWKPAGMPIREFLNELHLLRNFMDDVYREAGCPGMSVYIQIGAAG